MEREWALVLFTLLNQASVGLLAITLLANPKEEKIRKKLFSGIGLLAILSLLISLGHLGSPLGAYRALTNLGTSWLSREVFFASLYVALWVVVAYLEFKAGAPQSARNTLGWITLAVGVAAIYSMASVYTHTIRPAWQTAYTPISFFAASLVLGSLLYIVFHPAPRWVAWLTALGVGVQLLALPPYLAALGSGNTAAQNSARLLADSMFALGLGVAGIMAAAALAFLPQSRTIEITSSEQGRGVNFLYLALVAGIIGEGILRYLFYSTGVNIMVGHF